MKKYKFVLLKILAAQSTHIHTNNDHRYNCHFLCNLYSVPTNTLSTYYI
jgi:hypothetical protein